MSNIDNIINKLKEETEDKIKDIQDESRNKAEIVRAELIEAAKVERDRILEQAKNRADTTYTRISENAQIRIRDQRLVERQKLIDKVLKLALAKLNGKTDSEFVEEVKMALQKVDDSNLSLRLPESRLEAVKEANLNLKIDEESFVENGFVLISDRMNYNFKYDDILRDERDVLGPEIIKLMTE